MCTNNIFFNFKTLMMYHHWEKCSSEYLSTQSLIPSVINVQLYHALHVAAVILVWQEFKTPSIFQKLRKIFQMQWKLFV